MASKSLKSTNNSHCNYCNCVCCTLNQDIISWMPSCVCCTNYASTPLFAPLPHLLTFLFSLHQSASSEWRESFQKSVLHILVGRILAKMYFHARIKSRLLFSMHTLFGTVVRVCSRKKKHKPQRVAGVKKNSVHVHNVSWMSGLKYDRGWKRAKRGSKGKRAWFHIRFLLLAVE